MVGKSVEVKSSRIFHQCYVKCCKLQNLTPLNNVIPSGNGKVLDFCVDRIKYADWPPILNALSCDLSLHSASIKCRQQVKTVLEHIDCERLAKTVNKRAVILTNFMLSNLVEAISQLLSNTTLLTSLLLEGLPLKIPYLNPICEALLVNSSLQHLYLPRCLIGDAGCQAICKAVRCLPNILTLDLSGCELTPLGAGYIADLVKYQKIHRYSDNWVHTLRYRLPELDAMAGLRRLSLCANPQLGDAAVRKLLDALADDLWIKAQLGALSIYRLPELDAMAGLRRLSLCANPQLGDAAVRKLLDALADDLWIKALDIQNCGLTEDSATAALHMMTSNTTLVVLDMRHNPLVSNESLSKLRAALRQNERGMGGQYSWLSLSGSSCDGRTIKSVPSKNGIRQDRGLSNVRNASNKYPTKMSTVKKERDYSEELEEQLQEEISHRQQLEELNLQLVEQMKRLKQQQIQLWANGANSSGSEQSFQASSRSGDLSSSSGSTSSVPIDQNTLSYIQQAFKDIYAFIKNNQCNGECLQEKSRQKDRQIDDIPEVRSTEELEATDVRINIAKKAQSTHIRLTENVKREKITKSAHLLGDVQYIRDSIDTKPEMIERHMGDTQNVNEEQIMNHIISQTKLKKSSYERGSSCGSVSDSSDTLVYSPHTQRSAPAPLSLPLPLPLPRDALYSSSDEDEED